jgi:uncharacterized surface protein with fasciclin (FAS1) repeats
MGRGVVFMLRDANTRLSNMTSLHRLTSVAFTILLASLLVSCDSGAESPPSQTLAERIDGSSTLETFSAALQEYGLISTLEGRGPFMVFAPSDDAFDALLEDRDLTVEDLLASDDLGEVLAYHIVAAEISAPAIEDGYLFTTEQGGDLEARIDGGVVSLIGAENTVRVTGQPIDASNGVLLVVDGVLLPEGVLPQPETSSVVGRVVDALEPTQPIEGAMVSIVQAGVTASTDFNGEFDLAFAADSSGQPFTLRVTREGYETATRNFEARLGSAADVSDITMLPLFSIEDPLMASRAAVDFSAGESVTFTARFSIPVNWVLEIVGQESGAVKRIEGFSAELTAENTRWEGGTTILPLFSVEAVEARLFVPEEDADASRVTLDVLAPRAYEGAVFADFEGDDDITVLNPEFELDPGSGISAEVPPAQGDGFYLLRDTDDVLSNFFVGLITITPPGGGTFEVPTNNADELYFNCFLYGYGTPNTIAAIEVAIDANGSGAYEENQDSFFSLGYDVEFPNVGEIDYRGWRPYAEPASSFGSFGMGLTDEQTQQIVAVRVLLISDQSEQPTPPLEVEYGIDYITFTAGRPLQL